MGLSDLFIDPSTLPDDGYGLIQLASLLIGYGNLLLSTDEKDSLGTQLMAHSSNCLFAFERE